MKLYELIKIALENFWSRRMRAILTISAVTIGIAAIIFLISLGYGLEKLVTSQVASFDAFTILDVPSANLKTQKINEDAVNRIKSTGHIESVTPVINLGGRIKPKEKTTTTESVVQASTSDYLKLSGTPIRDGKWLENDNDIVINKTLANLLFGENWRWDTVKNSKINLDLVIERDLRAPDQNEGSVTANVEELNIIGVVDEGANPIGYITLDQAYKSGVLNYSSLKLKIDDTKNVEKVRKGLENLGYSTEWVGDTVKQIQDVFMIFRIVLGAFGLIALLVASLGTFNTLTISLLERIREIGLMKVLGMQSRDIYRLFMTESLFIGLTGGFIGIIIGYFSGLIINTILTILAKRAEVEAITVFYTPITLALGIAIFSILVGFMTGWYPARRAVKTNALDAIRYE